MKKKICIVTAARAEYGLLRPVINKIMRDGQLEAMVAVTGAHLSPEFGLTAREIEKDGIAIDKKIEILLSADTAPAISKSMGLALIGFSDYFEDKKPDAVLLLGDRYETLAVAVAAMNARVPIFHLYGGETTQGAVDEAIRHAVTKMAYLHFTSTECYRRRVIQMGESPERVFCVGALGVENALHTDYLTKAMLSEELGIDLERPYALVTFHPVTLEEKSAKQQAEAILEALEEFPEWNFIMTKANADRDGRIINRLFEAYASTHRNVKLFSSIGTKRYLSAMRYCRMVIGNSSSGLIEAPSFKAPTINIGDRQLGRIKAESVTDCLPEKSDIVSAMLKADAAIEKGLFKETVNPYGNGNTSDQIVQRMKEALCVSGINLKKVFFDIA